MSGRPLRRLPVVPTEAPIQLVLGLDGVGIRKPRRKRSRGRHPWLPAPRTVAAA